jgi:arylsulfatase A-like enzyme
MRFTLLSTLCFLSAFLAYGQSPPDAIEQLYDLNTDPTELYDVVNDEKYAGSITKIKGIAERYNEYKISPEVPPNTGKMTLWKEVDAVIPWATDHYVSEPVEQKYNFTEGELPPHIIFILVDDWGWNDFGKRSTYLNWTTPTIDKLADEGILLESYTTHELCTPSRGALLTGRYPLRLGLMEQHVDSELPLSEITLAQEMKSAGYKTYMVGKWHLGMSTTSHLPVSRGFDSHYGYLSGFIDYWNKTDTHGFLDLRNGYDLVRKESALSDELHSAYLFQSEAEKVIEAHVESFPDQPFFLYYAMQLIHGEWTAPESYKERCSYPETIDDDYVREVTYNYCAMNVMMDEMVANLMCKLDELKLSENTVVVLASDNGGESTVSPNSMPFVGHKGTYFRGGTAATAMIHSKLIPEKSRGSKYYGTMHVTDWLPTLMNVATNGAWEGSLRNHPLDGYNMWDVIMANETSPRNEIIFYLNDTSMCIQYDNLKYFAYLPSTSEGELLWTFDKDQAPENSEKVCAYPSLVDADLNKRYSSSITGYSEYASEDGEDETGEDADTIATESGMIELSAPSFGWFAFDFIGVFVAAVCLIFITRARSRRDYNQIGDDDTDAEEGGSLFSDSNAAKMAAKRWTLFPFRSKKTTHQEVIL